MRRSTKPWSHGRGRALVLLTIACTLAAAAGSGHAAPSAVVAPSPPTIATREEADRLLLEPPPPAAKPPHRNATPADEAAPSMLPWMIAGAELVAMLALFSYAAAQRRRTKDLLDELSRAKSYVAVLKRAAARMPDPDAPPPR